MTIDWTNFTPWASLAGGVLLGIASALFILANGRILGISGIAPVTLKWLAPAGFLSAPRIDASVAAVVVAGLLVGYGTRLGSGCTSGHGVCGLSRLSPRSLVATGSFMAAGFAIVFVIKHLL